MQQHAAKQFRAMFLMKKVGMEHVARDVISLARSFQLAGSYNIATM
jgi:hypothetical protein